MRKSFLSFVVLLGLLAGSFTIFGPRASGASGDLTQKAGTDGCVTETGSSGACADGTAVSSTYAGTVSPDGNNVYLAASSSDAIAIFDRDSSTGVITQKSGAAGCVSDDGTGGACADGSGLDGPEDVVVSSDGNNVYVASFWGDAIAIFDRNTATGELTQKSGTDGCISETGADGCLDGKALVNPNSIRISADGENVYVASYSSFAVAIFDRDTATGVLSQDMTGTAGCISETGTSGTCADGRALMNTESVFVSPDDKSVYASAAGSNSIAIFDRDLTTGDLTQKAGTAGCVSETGTSGACADGIAMINPGQSTSVTVTPDNQNVYLASTVSGAIAIFDRDTTTGELTQKPGTDGCVSDTGTSGACADGTALGGAVAVVTSPDGNHVYVVSSNSNAVAIFDRDQGTGVLTQKTGTAGCTSNTGTSGACLVGKSLSVPFGVAISPDGENLYVTAWGSGGAAIFDRSLESAPTAVDDTATVDEDDPPTTIDVLANDTDVTGSTEIISVTQPANGTVVITNDGEDLTYEPNPDYCNTGGAGPFFAPQVVPPTESFTYTLNGGSTATVTVTVNCAAVDTPPTAVNDMSLVNEDDPATTIPVLVNDSNPDGGPMFITSTSDPANGTVVITNSGADLTYEPDDGYCNDANIDGDPPDEFTYTLNGGSTATVFMAVTCTEDVGTAVDDSFTVNEGSGPSAVDVLDNDTDPDGNTQIDSVTQPPNGTVVLVDGTTLTYEPDSGYCNDGDTFDSFTYTLVGGSTATVNMTVTCDALIQPDVKVKLFSDVSYVGNDVYSAHGKDQVRRLPVKRGTKMTYDFEIQNDGSSADTFMLRGNNNNVGYSVKFYDDMGTNITKAMFKGTYSTGSLDPEESIVIHVVLRLFPDVNLNNVKSIKVTAKSGLDPTIVDRAIGQAKPR